ncbi:hypothetical protein ACLKA6_008592 [Drosophila palustris]
MVLAKTLIESRAWVEQLPMALQMELGFGLTESLTPELCRDTPTILQSGVRKTPLTRPQWDNNLIIITSALVTLQERVILSLTHAQ